LSGEKRVDRCNKMFMRGWSLPKEYEVIRQVVPSALSE
jgi:hypothetical protein